MMTCYILFEQRSIADLVAPGELTQNWTITRINVPKEFRNKGYGTKLLKLILDDADRDMITLQLEPSPSDGLNYKQLVAWYKRYGFKITLNGYMKRLPS